MLSRIEVVENDKLEVIIRCPEITENIVALQRHIESFNHVQEVVSIKVDDSIRILKQTEIEMIEIVENGIDIYLCNGEVVQAKGRLNKLYQKLDNKQFVIASKSAVINIHYLEKLEASFSGNMTAFLVSGKKTSVTRKFIKEVKQRVNY